MKLSKQKIDDIGLHYGKVISNFLSMNEEMYEQKIPEYWDRYRGTWSSKQDKAFPWSNSADFNLPIITWVCDSHMSRTMDTIFGGDDIFKTTGLTEEAIEPAQAISDFLNHYFKKPEILWNPIQQYCQRMYVEGSGILIPKVSIIKKKSRRYSIIGETLNSAGMPTFSKAYKVMEGFLVPEYKEKEEIKIEVFNVALKDFFTNFNGDSVQDNEWVAYRTYLTKRQIKMNGMLEDESLKWINTENLDDIGVAEDKGEEVKDKNEAAGLNENIVEEKDKPVELFVISTFHDISGKGDYKRIDLVIERYTNRVFYINENNDFFEKRRMVLSGLFPIAGMLIGSGFSQRLASMVDEFNTIHNQIIDNTTKINADIYTVISSLLENPSQDLSNLQAKPGRFIPVKKHEAIQRLNTQVPQVNLNSLEMMTMTLIERLAIITDTAMGRESDVERPTFRGKYLNLQEFLVNFGILMQQFQTGLKELITHILELMYQNMPSEGISYSVNTDNQIKNYKLTRENLEYFIDGQIELYVTVNSMNAAKGVIEQKMMMIFDRLMNDQSGEIDTSELKKIFIETIYPSIKERIIRDPKEIQRLQELNELLEQKARILKQKELSLSQQTMGMEGQQPEVLPPTENMVEGGQEGGGTPLPAGTVGQDTIY